MGSFAIRPRVQIPAWLITAILVYLNIRMVAEQAAGYFSGRGYFSGKALIVVAGLLFVALLVIAIVYPRMKAKRRSHPDPTFIPKPVPADPFLTRLPADCRGADFSDNDSNCWLMPWDRGIASTSYLPDPCG